MIRSEEAFAGKDGKIALLRWYKENDPPSFEEFQSVKEKVDGAFPGSQKLIKRLESDKTTQNFLCNLAELNIANLLLVAGVSDLRYEPEEYAYLGIDFSFGDYLVNLKSATQKKFQVNERAVISSLKASGGGGKALEHKGSIVELNVEMVEDGLFSEERVEIGRGGGFSVGSDLDILGGVLKPLGLMDSKGILPEKKLVLLTCVYTDGMSPYHFEDIARWYYKKQSGSYHPLLTEDRYMKLFGQAVVNRSVDLIAYLYPSNRLIWQKKDLNRTTKGVSAFTAYATEKEKSDAFRREFLLP